MTTNYDSQDRGDFSDVLASDRVLDAIGRGERVENADALTALLASARAQADSHIPTAPRLADLLAGGDAAAGSSVAPSGSIPESSSQFDATSGADHASTVTPSARGRKHLFRRGASAAAAGGASITTMLVAGGVAAAIAVGGLGYAAYTVTQPPQKPASTQADDAPQYTTGATGGAEDSTASSTASRSSHADEPRDAQPTERDARESKTAHESATSIAPEASHSMDTATLAEGLRSAVQDPRVTGLPGYTPPPPVAEDQAPPLPNYDPNLGKFEEPLVPGLNRPMVQGPARQLTHTKESDSSDSQADPYNGLPSQPHPGDLLRPLGGTAGSTDTR